MVTDPITGLSVLSAGTGAPSFTGKEATNCRQHFLKRFRALPSRCRCAGSPRIHKSRISSSGCSWVRSSISPLFSLATCSIPELGFVRARVSACLRPSSGSRFTFISDDHDVSRLSGAVRTVRQVPDGQFCDLERGNSAVLATLDENIPGAYLIPR
jgi:hypothetical protein